MYITPAPPGAVFQARLLDNQEGANTERRLRLRKALGEMLPTPTFLTTTLFQVWRYRARKIGPGGCDPHRRIIRETPFRLEGMPSRAKKNMSTELDDGLKQLLRQGMFPN